MKKTTVLLFTVLMLLAGLARADSAPGQWVEGEHYFRVPAPQPVDTGDKIEIRELFWYGCPHCAHLQPELDRWLANGLPDNAEFVLMPAILRKSWAPHARIFYAFRDAGVVDKVHSRFFSAIHDQKKAFPDAESIAEFVAENGGSGADFLKAYRSFSVDAEVRRAAELSRAYGVTGVPAIVVDGKYRTSVLSGESYDQLFDRIAFLVKKAAAERSGQARQ